MCGVAGVVYGEARPVDRAMLGRMAAAIRHRGPDGYGFVIGRRGGLAHVRLSIIDRAGGAQPLGNEDGQLQVAFNGEIFNYVELRAELRALGHVFRTDSDTEVLVHGYESWGTRLVDRLNGDFAFAIYDQRDDSLFLARDRFGVRPLFYTQRGSELYFASEAKALFASGVIDAAPDPAGLDEVFTLWAARAPRTVFRGVQQLEPGTIALWRDGRLVHHRYFTAAGSAAREEPSDAVDALDRLMYESVRLRMRADVPVAAYASGGLDSTITATLAATMTPHDLRTFSVSFDDAGLDESVFQEMVASSVKSRHVKRRISGSDIARVFPSVVRHAETPLLRTAPAPMYLLAEATRQDGIVCVLTGEGSDELFLGYDLFKEVQVRQFCRRRPDSHVRPRLFDRLYPYVHTAVRGELWRRSMLDAGNAGDALDSHVPRFRLAARIRGFYDRAWLGEIGDADALTTLRDSLPAGFDSWRPLARAAYLEITTLLPSYLLSSQGDRMMMAHGVEGRFPFLDPQLFVYAASLPERSKLCGLREKEILKRWARSIIPTAIVDRHKQPYRAPNSSPFFGGTMPDYVRELLDSAALEETGIFAPAAVEGLVRRAKAGRTISDAENQAVVAILSTQLWHREFMGAPRQVAPLAWEDADVRTGDPEIGSVAQGRCGAAPSQHSIEVRRLVLEPPA
jgi:asparagine synthase (glutamine-hydrolysing)